MASSGLTISARKCSCTSAVLKRKSHPRRLDQGANCSRSSTGINFCWTWQKISSKKNGWMMVNDSRIKPALPSDPRDLFWDILSVRLLQSKPSRAWMALTASSCACKLQPEAPEWFVVLHLNIFNTSTTEEMLNFVQFCLQRQWHPMTNGLPCLAKFNQEMAWKAAVATMPRELIAPAALVSKLGHCKMIEARKQVSNLLILPNTS